MLHPRLAACLAAISLIAPNPARATHAPSLGSSAVQSANASLAPSISADGRYVAFASAATKLVAEDTNGFADVFVYDLATGATTCVSVAADGARADGDSLDASISADGRYVAFRSFASNLVAGDTNGLPDVFMHDRLIGATCRVSEQTLRALASPELEHLDESPAAASTRSLLQARGWMWTDVSGDDSEGLLLARCSENASGLDWSSASSSGYALAPPADFLLTAPADGASLTVGLKTAIIMEWEASSGADSYTIEIADEPSFASPIHTYPVAGTETTYILSAGALQINILYYWRMHAINPSGPTVATNAPFQFTMHASSSGHSSFDDTMGFCFVATAAYGSPMEPEVQTLRNFRDRVLVRTAPGRAFVDWYYRNSPPLAAAIAERPAWRTTTRVLLWPVVGFANVVLWSGERPISASALAIVLLTLAWLGVRHVRRLRRSRALVRRELATAIL